MEQRALPPRQAGLGALLSHLFTETRHLVVDYAELAVLDARRAAIMLAWLLGAVLVVAVLVVSAWMGGLAALIVWASEEGISWGIALGAAALVNLLAAGALVWWAKRMLQDLPFTALLRQLKGEDPASEKA